jgi:predicted AlkP superfamily pyrophosphatase or phosphodiesterase
MTVAPMKTFVTTLVLALSVARPGGARADAPRVLVMVVIDQMRADYIDWYGGSWKGGLRRLIDEGAWLRNARYPYLETVTCAGHATIGTGAFPHRHGMILNTWYDRDRKKVIECTDDPEARPIAYGHPARDHGDSPRNLAAPTLADELRAQLHTAPRTVSFAIKPRAALTLIGHHPDLSVWFDGEGWTSSSVIAQGPAPWLTTYLAAHPPDTSAWTPLLPPAAYQNIDDAPYERPTPPWTRTFPHALGGDGIKGLARWMSSPAADAYVEGLAAAAITEMKLGQGPGTDLLAVSFATTDLVGHYFGPRSREVQDSLARVDADLGRLLATLDEKVGRGKYTVALSSDHGVALVPEGEQGGGGGRITAADLGKAAEAAVAAELGPGKHVVEVQLNELYLAPGDHQRLLARKGAVGRVLAALRAVPGVEEALDAEGLNHPGGKGVRAAAALSFFPGRSGDLLIVPRTGWVVGSLNTNHGSVHDYDQRVPLVFFGHGIRPGRYDQPVTPADLAPTLGHIAGVRMPRAEGHPLKMILAR